MSFAHGGGRTSLHDSVRNAVYHFIRELCQHVHWERTSFLPWFSSRVSIVLQRSLAHAIHARTLSLEQSMALLSPPPLCVPLSFA